MNVHLSRQRHHAYGSGALGILAQSISGSGGASRAIRSPSRRQSKWKRVRDRCSAQPGCEWRHWRRRHRRYCRSSRDHLKAACGRRAGAIDRRRRRACRLRRRRRLGGPVGQHRGECRQAGSNLAAARRGHAYPGDLHKRSAARVEPAATATPSPRISMLPSRPQAIGPMASWRSRSAAAAARRLGAPPSTGRIPAITINLDLTVGNNNGEATGQDGRVLIDFGEGGFISGWVRCDRPDRAKHRWQRRYWRRQPDAAAGNLSASAAFGGKGWAGRDFGRSVCRFGFGWLFGQHGVRLRRELNWRMALEVAINRHGNWQDRAAPAATFFGGGK